MTVERLLPFPRKGFLAYSGVVLAIYVGLILTGVTTSSISFWNEGAGYDAEAIMVGEPQPIRSDEYRVWSPYEIGRHSPSWDENTNTPLDIRHTVTRQLGEYPPVQTAIFPEDALIRLIPGEHGFAAYWWKPTVIMLLALPAFLLLLGLGVTSTAAATALVALSAPMAWWSYLPATMVGVASAVGALALGSQTTSGRRLASNSGAASPGWAALVLAVSAGWFAARLPFLYQPWSIPVTIYFGTITVIVLRARRGSRWMPTAVLAAVLGLTAVAFSAAYIFEQRDLYRALASTAYPGTRRATGDLSLGLLGDSVTWMLQTGAGVVGTNPSEAARGLVILMVPMMILLLIGRISPDRAQSATKAATYASAVILVIFLAWASFAWPTRLSHLTPLTFVPPIRMIQILGVLAPLGFVMAVQVVERPVRRVTLLVSLSSFWLLAIWGTQAKNTYLPSLTNTLVVLSAGSFALALVWAINALWPATRWLPLVGLSALTVLTVNPLANGLGELTGSSTASKIVRLSGTDELRWATESSEFDTLLAANTVPMLSGEQFAGPNEDAWRNLDPNGIYRDVWNRAVSYIYFDWQEGAPISMVNPALDTIVISMDPCDPALTALQTGWIVSNAPLSGSCLTSAGRVKWEDQVYEVYQRS